MIDLVFLEDSVRSALCKKEDCRNLIVESDEWFISWFRLLGTILVDLCQKLIQHHTPINIKSPSFQEIHVYEQERQLC